MQSSKCAKFETVAKGGFEPGLSQLRVRHSTTELPSSSLYAQLVVICVHFVMLPLYINVRDCSLRVK